jgi:hypothetical protein
MQTMTDQPTCGKGLAENAALPAALGELLAGMATVLDVHRRTLDRTDPDTGPEADAYATLVTDVNAASARLAALARKMSGYRDLPMGRHDPRAMSGRDAVDALAGFVQSERKLLSMLTATVGEYERMLEQMASSRST